MIFSLLSALIMIPAASARDGIFPIISADHQMAKIIVQDGFSGDGDGQRLNALLRVEPVQDQTRTRKLFSTPDRKFQLACALSTQTPLASCTITVLAGPDSSMDRLTKRIQYCVSGPRALELHPLFSGRPGLEVQHEFSDAAGKLVIRSDEAEFCLNFSRE